MHSHTEALDHCVVETVILAGRQVWVLCNEEGIIAQVRFRVLEHEPHIFGHPPVQADGPGLHLAAERDSVWIELIVISVRYATGEEPGSLAASRIVEGTVALVEDIEFSHDLQSAPAATAVEHRVINYRTAPPAPLLIRLVPAEEPASFAIPAV